MATLFRNRSEAGRLLAEKLHAYQGRADGIVLGLPRGGLLVAYEVATRLGLPLDVLVVRKLGLPGNEEFAIGAIASGGVCVLNQGVLGHFANARAMIAAVAAQEGAELSRREKAYRGARPAPELRGRLVILVDDGLATGATMRAAIAAVRQQGATEIVVAVPVAALATCRELAREVTATVCLATPDNFLAIGPYYQDFTQTTDAEVCALLAASMGRGVSADGAPVAE